MFQDCTPAIAINPPGWYSGLAACDFDRDGQLEFLVAGFAGPNRVLKWTGNALRDVAPPTFADPTRRAISLAAGDFDGDGAEEIYVLNANTSAGTKPYADRLFDCHPDGTWHDLFDDPQHAPLRNHHAGRSVAVIDRRGTGRYSFFVANDRNPVRMYELTPGELLCDLAPSLGLRDIVAGRGLLVAPLASDRPDIFLVTDHGPNLLLRNTGVGTFLEVATEHQLHDPGEHGRGVSAFDLGDGQLGVCFGNWDGPHRLMQRRDAGRFRDVATPAMAMPSQLRNVIVADFDNDGYEEIFFHNYGESNRVFRQHDGEWHMANPSAATEPDGLGTGAAIADVDADGRLELLLAHGEAALQPLSLYKSPANENAWIRIQPQTRFGAPARGAVVRLTASGRVQTRVICGGSGYLCQMEPVAHFGLGSQRSVDSVQVVWPDGVAVTLARPEIRREVRVAYPQR